MAIATPRAKLGQPKALPVLFFTEMWERFSYYGMRALLVLYLVRALGYERKDALELYGIYTGLVYLTPVLGGYLADRWLGTRKSILIGGLTMALGHFAMAFPALLHPALGLLIVGNGFFKPNITTLLGSYYDEHDARRDGGFTIFYMGINLGAFLAPLVAGTLGEQIGWHWGFASAGVGMILGLLQFAVGQRRLGTHGLPAGQARFRRKDWVEVVLLPALAVPLVFFVIALGRVMLPVWTGWSIPSQLLVTAGVVLVLWFGFPRAPAGQTPMSRQDWQRVAGIAILGLFVVFFWMGFEQAGGTMSLFADKLTDRHVGSWEIPASYFQAINPLAIIALGPVLSAVWARIDRTRFALSAPAKMGLGMVILGLGFVILAVAQGRAERDGWVGPQWLVSVYLVHTVGELFLSPIGLSMVTKVAPRRLAAALMGMWMTANAIANYLAGALEGLLASTHIPLYWFLVGTSIGAGLVLLAITPVLKRLMQHLA